MSKKRYDPFKHVMDSGTLYTGTMFSASMPSMIGRNLPGVSNIHGQIHSGPMQMLPMIPYTHTLGGVFGSLYSLEKTVKKRK